MVQYAAMSLHATNALSHCARIQALAERDPRRAVALAERALARCAGSGDAPLAAYTLGWALLCWERFDDARAQLHAAQELLAQQPDRAAGLRCRLALLMADVFQHGRPDLLPRLAALATEFAAAGLPAEANRAQLYRAILFNILGNVREGAAQLSAIEPAMMAAQNTDTVRWLRVRAVAAVSQHEQELAQELLRRSGLLAAALHSPLEHAKCLYELAWSDLQAERLGQALHGFRQARQIFQQLKMLRRYALSLHGCGSALMRQGQYHQALPDLLAALELFQQLGQRHHIAQTQLELGNLSFFTGQWEAALAYYLRSEATFETAAIHGSAIAARRNRATVYRAQKRYAEADALLHDCEARARELGLQSELAPIWQEQANLLAATGAYRASTEKFRQARQEFLAGQNELGAADCAIEQGQHALDRRDVATAEALFRQAEPALAQHPHHLWRALGGLARCAAARGDRAEALDRYRAALSTIAALRERLATEAISSSVYQLASDLHAEALGLALAANEPETVLAIAEDQRALVLRRLLAAERGMVETPHLARHDALRAAITGVLPSAADGDIAANQQLDRVLADYGELLLHTRHRYAPAESSSDAAPSFDLARTRDALATAYGDDWTALCYTEHAGTLLLHVLTPGDLWEYSIAADDAFAQLIRRASLPEYRHYTYRGSAPSQPAPAAWNHPRALADQLLPPAARARLHPNHRLLIVPAGTLHGLPWPVLRLGDTWLVEQAIIQLAPSLQAWQALGNRASTSGGDALIMGCSEFGTRALPLATVGEEAALVARHWPGRSHTLLDAQATRSALLALAARGELRRYGLLHFATHAQLLPGRGLVARIELWDDSLLLPEVAALNLNNPLVVLATCDGAAVDTLPGEEHFGLARTLLVAGAAGVVASVWPVSNEAALAVVDALYAAMAQQPDAASALAHAQRALLAASTGGEASAPFDWGGFMLMGRWRR